MGFEEPDVTMVKEAFQTGKNFKSNIDLINEDVLKLIVKMSEGSVRDSLSLLDRIFLSEGGNKEMDLKSAQEIFGYFDKSYVLDLVNELLNGDEQKVSELYRNI